jgi:hypothetical protein
MHTLVGIATAAATTLLSLTPIVTEAGITPGAPAHGSRVAIGGIELLGEVSFPTGTTFAGTQVGGLSGIAYDSAADRYLAISDDRSQLSPARFYELAIDLGDGTLDTGDVTFTGVTTLRRADGSTYPALSLDPEGIALGPDSTVYVSSEGDTNAGIAPFVNQYRRSDGQVIEELDVPDGYLPNPPSSGIRNNLAFESLTATPAGKQLVTATENALAQDGPAATSSSGSPSRVLVYDNEKPKDEYRYDTDPVSRPAVPAGSFATNGLVELLALDDKGSFLALERSFSTGVGNDVHLYRFELDQASRLGPGEAPADVPSLRKELVLDLGELGLTIDNLEAMTFGPVLPDGRRSLIVVSDNNFSPTQVTQVLAFALDIDVVAGPPAVRFATFNASLNRSLPGQLLDDLAATPDASPAQTLRRQQARNVAEVIQRVRPDVLLINEFDDVGSNDAIDLFRTNFLEVSQNGAAPIEYPYAFVATSNTGIPTGKDLNNDGTIGGPDDAFGFGFFRGQFGMAVLSMHPIDLDAARTFQLFKWEDMPGNLIPTDFYGPDEVDILRLSSKSHWDLPISIYGETVHFLVSHPTPPVFDGPEDRNGRRNHDEIRFWADYVDPAASAYIYDDDGVEGGLAAGERFVIAGDQNADPLDGDSVDQAIQQLLEHPQVQSTPAPSAPGGTVAALQGGLNATHDGDPRYDTADFADGSPGNLRADYVLASTGLGHAGTGIFWPEPSDPLSRLTGVFTPSLPGGFPTSDHRLVWLDVDVRQ